MKVTCTGWRNDPEDNQRPLPKACGAKFDVRIGEHDANNSGDPTTWDVDTDTAGKIVRQHASVQCPNCGVRTFIVRNS